MQNGKQRMGKGFSPDEIKQCFEFGRNFAIEIKK